MSSLALSFLVFSQDVFSFSEGVDLIVDYFTILSLERGGEGV
jgi:hypothetical protein